MEPNSTALTFHSLSAPTHAAEGPDTRLARMAARRAFVEMKQCFMRAAADIAGDIGESLQAAIRQSSEVTELWRLRSALFDALPQDGAPGALHRRELRQHLDSAFPDAGEDTGFTPL